MEPGILTHEGHMRAGVCAELTPGQDAEYMLPGECTMKTMQSMRVIVD